MRLGSALLGTFLFGLTGFLIGLITGGMGLAQLGFIIGMLVALGVLALGEALKD